MIARRLLGLGLVLAASSLAVACGSDDDDDDDDNDDGFSYGTGGTMGAQDLINLLTAKTAQELSLDLSLPRGGGAQSPQ